ncbi:PDZ domain-containing protein [Paenibacillus sp. ACRRX]|uniref:YlbL family protein n=1 Tax=Paenibacillus sp. ACRRX TaxID=2918206 RepID=UPI001EF611AC|nr:S16 family serine protease [Paenibacillus sp. ACRRX]MCG7407547.1 PDZ domain-containing protein [Paenibacillus sp. ACRRX]
MTDENLPYKNPVKNSWSAWKWFVAGLLLIYFLVFMPTPYVIYEPGSAEAVKPMVEVAAGDNVERGTFMLTTVRRTYANMALLAWSSLDKTTQIAKKEDALQGRSEAEYSTALTFMMSGSQSNAVLAAYNKVGVPYQIVKHGIFVIYNDPKIAHNEFVTNDRIDTIEGVKTNGYEDIQKALHNRKAGETLTVKVEREGKLIDVKATLAAFVSSQSPDKKIIGFGIQYGEKKEIVPADSGKKIVFKDSDIGGPSAGLMFTLELINRLTPGDLTHGHKIAGTGEITPDGQVGIIGGIQHKVVAADREGAVMFLAPEGNYAEAKAKVDTMDTKMKLVSVRTLDDALRALDELDAAGK